MPEEVMVSFDLAAAAGVSEAQDHYRLGQYEDAVAAAQKTLGRLSDPHSNLMRLLVGELTETHAFERQSTESTLRSRLVPSRDMALSAFRSLMCALVALVEDRPGDEQWTAMLRSLSHSIITFGLDDRDIRVLAAQGFLLAGEYERAMEICRAVLCEDPLHHTAGSVAYQAARRSGNMEGARALATSLIADYEQQVETRYHALALRLAYSLEDWGDAIRIGRVAAVRAPEEMHILAPLTSALLIAGRRDEARGYYDQMCRVAPSAPQTQQLGRAFAS